MTLLDAEIGRDYTIKSINTFDEELNSFLFSLGCYSGETIRIISVTRKNFTIVLKDSRYSIDSQLAEAIEIM